MTGTDIELEESEEPECECRRVDVDMDDASDCPIHGPGSEAARQANAREAMREAEYWQNVPEF